jgi:hypothetical protein
MQVEREGGEDKSRLYYQFQNGGNTYVIENKWNECMTIEQAKKYIVSRHHLDQLGIQSHHLTLYTSCPNDKVDGKCFSISCHQANDPLVACIRPYEDRGYRLRIMGASQEVYAIDLIRRMPEQALQVADSLTKGDYAILDRGIVMVAPNSPPDAPAGVHPLQKSANPNPNPSPKPSPNPSPIPKPNYCYGLQSSSSEGVDVTKCLAYKHARDAYEKAMEADSSLDEPCKQEIQDIMEPSFKGSIPSMTPVDPEKLAKLIERTEKDKRWGTVTSLPYDKDSPVRKRQRQMFKADMGWRSNE